MERDARDRIAEMVGWRKLPPGTHAFPGNCVTVYEGGDEVWGHSHWYRYGHPIPASLDFVAAAWPDSHGWHRDWKTMCFWWSTKYGDLLVRSICVDDTGNELADRLELLARTLEWLRDNDPPAFAAACEKVRKAMEEYR